MPEKVSVMSGSYFTDIYVGLYTYSLYRRNINHIIVQLGTVKDGDRAIVCVCSGELSDQPGRSVGNHAQRGLDYW